MKRVLLLLTVVFCTLGASHAQNIVIGERAPELKSVTWLASRNPAAADLSYLVFFHSSNKGCTASLDALRDLSNKLGSKLRIIIITQEDSEKIAPILTPYISERIGVALDHDKKVFGSFGVDFVQFIHPENSSINSSNTFNSVMSFTKINHYEKEYADTHHECALTVTEGVENQPVVNPYFVRKKKRALTTEEYVEGILQGNITTLSQAITLVESSNPDHYAQAQEIIEKCLPHAGKSVRIGITGVPGAGKSTFIEAVGNMVTSLKHKLAVLAIDPSSERSGGSILGDKTRMESISSNPKVFIRPSPSAGSLGGVARKTRETIILCEAAGFDVIFIETVGVGQSETAVHSMVDMFMMLQISGAGDELQGIKRGIMEMADMMVITKADGENIHKAELAKTQYQGALRLFPVPESGWRPKVYTCSAYTKTGLEEVWKGVEEFLDFIQANGYFTHNRNRQNKYWMYETIDEVLKNSFYHNPQIEPRITELEQKVLDAKVSSFVAAHELLELYFKNKN